MAKQDERKLVCYPSCAREYAEILMLAGMNSCKIRCLPDKRAFGLLRPKQIEQKIQMELSLPDPSAHGDWYLFGEESLEIRAKNGFPRHVKEGQFGELVDFMAEPENIVESMENVPDEERGALHYSRYTVYMPDGLKLQAERAELGTISRVVGVENKESFKYDRIFTPLYTENPKLPLSEHYHMDLGYFLRAQVLRDVFVHMTKLGFWNWPKKIIKTIHSQGDHMKDWKAFYLFTPEHGEPVRVQVTNFVQVREDRYDVAGIEEHICHIDECGNLRDQSGEIVNMDIRGRSGRVIKLH